VISTPPSVVAPGEGGLDTSNLPVPGLVLILARLRRAWRFEWPLRPARLAPADSFGRRRRV